MPIEDIMSISITNLAVHQEQALLSHAVSILNRAEEALTKGDRSLLEEITFDSPAGDGYGLDNRCLNFQFVAKSKAPIDIADVFDMLARLRETRKAK